MDRFKFRVYVTENDAYPEKVGYVNTDDFYIHPDGEESYFDADYDFAESVIEQCTGLKDKNGKLIYEGDIFKATVINSFDGDETLYKTICGQISWCDIEGCFAFARYHPSDLFEIEILGNIHENADLLGEE